MLDINDSLLFLTCSYAKQMADVLNDKLKEYGISKVQWHAIYFIGMYEQLSVCELANKMHVKHSSATRLLNRMEKDGLVEKVKDDEDKRVTHVKLTELASDIRREVLPIWDEINRAARKNITDEEIARYKKLLDQISSNIAQS